ncbi:MAG: hypothetical protein ABI459_10815 [Deltaproteobacteria bacterium]
MALRLEEFEPTLRADDDAGPPSVPPFDAFAPDVGGFGAAPAGDFGFPPAADSGFGATGGGFDFPPAAPAAEFPAPAGDFAFPAAAPASGDGTIRDYDAGYKAGWEDAERRHESEAQRLSEALLHSVQDLGFTLHEARVHVLKMLRPLVESMIGALVPEVSKAALPVIVADEIEQLAVDLANEPLTLRICADDRVMLERALASVESSLQVKLVVEPSLIAGQVLISTENLEKRIDLDEVQTRIITALRTLSADYSSSPEINQNMVA